MLPVFKDMTMTAIQARDIVTFRAKLFERGLARKTVNNLMNLLNLFFEDAVEDGYLRQSPMPKGRRKKRYQQPRRTLGRALEPEEFQALLANCDEPRTRLIVLIAALAGLRRGELFALKWEDIDFEQNVIHVRRSLIFLHGRHIVLKPGEKVWRLKVPKTPDGYRDVDMSPVLKAELKSWQREQTHAVVTANDLTERLPRGLVFCRKNGEPMTPNWFQKHTFTLAVLAAGIGRCRFHDLRHSFGSWKLALGEDLIYVSKQMGHANPSITANVYAHVIRARRPDAATRTDDFVFTQKKADHD